MTNSGLRLLSLDGGGTKGLVELLLLQEIMHRIKEDLKLPEQPRPCEVFDWIAGTGTGGLNALLLGRLELTVPVAIEEYRRLFRAACNGENEEDDEPHSETNMLAKTKPSEKSYLQLFKATLTGERDEAKDDMTAKTERFEKSLRHIVKRHANNTDAPFRDNASRCRTFVCSAAQYDLSHPRLLRSYSVRNNDDHPTATICEVARATAALPKAFLPISIGKPIPETLIGGDILCNNPTLKLFQEARGISPEKQIACVLSLGAGNPGIISLTEISELGKVSYQICKDCEETANNAAKELDSSPTVYWRLNPEQGFQGWDEEEWNKEGTLQTFVKSYLKKFKVSQDVDRVVENLKAGLAENLGLAENPSVAENLKALVENMKANPAENLKVLVEDPSLAENLVALMKGPNLVENLKANLMENPSVVENLKAGVEDLSVVESLKGLVKDPSVVDNLKASLEAMN